MKLKLSGFAGIMLGGILLVGLAFSWLLTSPYFDSFYQFAQSNYFLFTASLFVIKILGFVFPPIPGGTFTLGSIPFIGWLPAYLIDLIGGLIGACIVYQIGKKWGLAIISKLFDEKTVSKIKGLKIKKNRELEAMIVMRVLATGLATEAVFYGAGLLKINLTKFIIGFVLTHLVLNAPTYYFSNLVFGVRNFYLNAVYLVFVLLVLSKIKSRYFE